LPSRFGNDCRERQSASSPPSVAHFLPNRINHFQASRKRSTCLWLACGVH
jgi:hypothetical protein